MKKYQVIGGQYEAVNYGESDSLHGAKCIAAKCAEYWDNWQGWHYPAVYSADDCQRVTARGWITQRDGRVMIIPNPGALPVYLKKK